MKTMSDLIIEIQLEKTYLAGLVSKAIECATRDEASARAKARRERNGLQSKSNYALYAHTQRSIRTKERKIARLRSELLSIIGV